MMTTTTDTTAKDRRKDHPTWAAPAVLSLIMLSSGAMFLMIAQGISILSSVSY